MVSAKKNLEQRSCDDNEWANVVCGYPVLGWVFSGSPTSLTFLFWEQFSRSSILDSEQVICSISKLWRLSSASLLCIFPSCPKAIESTCLNVNSSNSLTESSSLSTAAKSDCGLASLLALSFTAGIVSPHFWEPQDLELLSHSLSNHKARNTKFKLPFYGNSRGEVINQ